MTVRMPDSNAAQAMAHRIWEERQVLPGKYLGRTWRFHTTAWYCGPPSPGFVCIVAELSPDGRVTSGTTELSEALSKRWHLAAATREGALRLVVTLLDRHFVAARRRLEREDTVVTLAK